MSEVISGRVLAAKGKRKKKKRKPKPKSPEEQAQISEDARIIEALPYGRTTIIKDNEFVKKEAGE